MKRHSPTKTDENISESDDEANEIEIKKVCYTRAPFDYRSRFYIPQFKRQGLIYKSLETTFSYTNSYAKNKKDLFYLGTYNISLIVNLNQYESLDNNSLFENNTYIYKSSDTYEVHINENDKDRKFEFSFGIKNDVTFEAFARLHLHKVIVFVNKSLNKDDNSILVDVYLNNKLKYKLANNPSECIHTKLSSYVFTIMQYFFNIENGGLQGDLNDIDYSIEKEESSENRDLLFDLVYYEHQKQMIEDTGNDINDDFKSNSFLIPILRPYQIDAIKWMLKQEYNKKYAVENYDEKQKKYENLIHPLYHKITNKFNQVIYYQKYLGVFSNEMPTYSPCAPGGILADDMGLGKTLEILGCVLLNQRVDIPKYEIEIDSEKFLQNEQSVNFSCICGNVPNGSLKNPNNTISYQCRSCGVWTHIKCVNYTGDESTFLCPLCCTLQKPYPSGCTLIITPSVISHQWIDEIKKHIKDKQLKVLLYKGCNVHGFIQPKDLASLDICITTYDVLSNELHYVWSIEKLPNLRRAKRFMSVPSPLICVEWWRICLDEAQMVHSTNAKCAEMANRLAALNRWCVTGTPIGKSLSDLHGLFSFIREDPFHEKLWFNELLYNPYKNGNKKPMVNALTKVLWRTTKRFVMDQIDIPEQIEKIYWLPFSPFEQHLYERVIEKFKETRGLQLDQLDLFSTINPNLRLDELDRDKFNKLLAPLMELRLTCNHPQLILRRAFTTNHNFKKERILTMEKSLQILTKKTKTECEQKYRSLIMSMNGIAGIQIIEKKYDDAIETYRNVLKSEKEYENKLTIDSLQKVHAIHNLNEILMIYKGEESNAELLLQLKESESRYMYAFDIAKQTNQEKLLKKVEAVDEKFNENAEGFQVWWLDLLSVIEESKKSREFLDKFSVDVSANLVYNSNICDNVLMNYTICDKTFTNFSGLKKICVDEYEKFLAHRKNLHDTLKIYFDEISNELVEDSTHCHLRQEASYSQKCDLCKCDSMFSTYAKHLFSHSDEILRFASTDGENNENDIDENTDDITERNVAAKLQRSASDLEKFFKVIINFCKNEPSLAENIEIGNVFLRTYDLLKDEFRVLRQFWLSVSNQINALDEVAMSKIRMRLREPHDSTKLSYVIDNSEVTYQFFRIENEKKMYEIELRKKLGQLLYLQNLIKSYTLVRGEENQEICPICQHTLGVEWYVLVCGHSYCKECTSALSKNDNPTPCACSRCGNLMSNRRSVRCALCREVSKHDETYLVRTDRVVNESNEPCMNDAPTSNNTATTSNKSEFDDIEIKGNSNSTKVEGVVKCLMKILRDDSSAKCLVFSQWPTMLDLIQESLKDNFMDYRYLKDNSHVQKALLEFKNNENVNILLMPYQFGGNGLNLIEATHVLIVEPNLNISQEMQAIGRVHRIGQTKRTFIHRFLVRNTIEEVCYNMFLGNAYYKRSLDDTQTNKNVITVADVHNLILNL